MNWLPTHQSSLPILSGFFIAVLLISTITSTKIIAFSWLTLDGGTLLFPLSYILGDIITEVYGYRASRRIIWMAIGSLLVFTLLTTLISILPAHSEWTHQDSYDTILGTTPRIVMGSIFAFFLWELSNSYILAKLKNTFSGKYLYYRMIISSIVGNGIDTVIFIIIAFFGIFSSDILSGLIVSNFIWKLWTEIILSPITASTMGWLKKYDHIDTYEEPSWFFFSGRKS